MGSGGGVSTPAPLGAPIGQCVSVTTPLPLPRKPTLIHLPRTVLVMLGGAPFAGSGSMPSSVVLLRTRALSCLGLGQRVGRFGYSLSSASAT